MTTEFSTELFSGPAGGGGGGSAEHHFDIKRMLRLRGPMMLAVAAALAIPCVAAVWFLTPLEFQASADLRFLAATQKVMYSDTTSSVPYDKYVNTQVSLIAGPTILSKVLDDPAVNALPALKRQIDPLAFLMGKVEARILPNTELVRVTCRMQDAEAAKTIVGKVIEHYINYASSDAAQAESDRLNILGKERDARQLEISSLRQKIVDLTRRVGVPVVGGAPQTGGPSETESFQQMLASAMEDLSGSESRIANAEEKRRLIDEVQAQYNARPGEPIFSLDIENHVSSDSRVAQLQSAVGQAEANLSLLKTNQVETSPQVKVASDRLGRLKQELARMQQHVRGEILSMLSAKASDELSLAQRAKDEAEKRRATANEQIENYRKQALDASGAFAELDELKAREAEMSELLREVRAEITKITMESKAPARVRQASDAIVPPSPNSKKRFQLMLMAVVGSFVAAAGFGLIWELMDQHIRSAQDMATLTSVPLLAAIPHAAEDRLEGRSSRPLLMVDHPNSTSAEEFRRILARIIYPPESSVEINTCLVASPMPGDGKTSMACNLAVALVQAKRRVLLIDINSRDRAIEESFALPPGAGLAEILTHQHSPDEVIRETSYPGLFVLGPGFVPGAMVGKLASRDMVDFLQVAEEEFDHVVIDSPPALLISDAKLLAPVVDGVVVVVSAGKTTRGMVRRCLREFEQVGANVIGMVLNGMRSTRGGYLRSNLKMYYGYSGSPSNGGADAEDLPEMIIIDDSAEDVALTMLPHVDHETGGESEHRAEEQA